jgi:hypothetical protein
MFTPQTAGNMYLPFIRQGCYGAVMAVRWCDVTVQTLDGRRHTIAVQAKSVYAAAAHFVGRSRAPNPGEQLPETTDDTVFEVRVLYRVSQRALLKWANTEAERAIRARH